MYFLENELGGNAGFDRVDSRAGSHAGSDLPWVEGAISQTIAYAIRDAMQTSDPILQQKAASWLLTCCPDIAEQVELPDLDYDRMPNLATAYLMSDASA